MESLHKDIQGLTGKVDRVLRTLIGDVEMEQEGLVTKVANHEKWIQQQKLLLAKVAGMAIGGGVVGGLVLELILKMM